MGKRGESWVVVFLVLITLVFILPLAHADNVCYGGSDTVIVDNPKDVIVVDFGTPVDVDLASNDIQFTFYPNSGGDTVDLVGGEAKPLELLYSENNQIFKFRPTEGYQEKFSYTLLVKGYSTGDDGDAGVLLERCKYIYVDYGPLAITLENPTQKYISTVGAPLTFSTNRESECRISTTTDDFSAMTSTLATSNGLDHTGTHPGTDTFYVACKDVEETVVSEEFTIIVDTTPPSVPIVDDTSDLPDYPDRWNQKSTLLVQFSAEDAESGIAFVNYTIADAITGVYVTDWMTTTRLDEPFFITDLSLTNGVEYKVVAIAQNRAGLTSAQGMSDGVLIDSFFDPSNAGPEVFCTNGILDDGEAYVDCGGICSGCALDHECVEDVDCLSHFCSPDTSVCTLPACDDGYQNGDESDLDCGSSCNETCALGLSCNGNADCSSNYCLSGICSEANCFDSVKNGGETDIDCGGTCDAACPAGRSCKEDADCESNDCDDFRKTCVGEDKVNEPEERESSGSGLIWLIILFVILGGLGTTYYLASNGTITLPPEISKALGIKHSGASSSSSSPSKQKQSPVQAQSQQAPAQASVQSGPQINPDELAAKLRKDLGRKEQKRDLKNLFGEFGKASETSSAAEPSKTEDGMVSKEDIDGLFGDVGSKSSLDKLSLKKKQ